MKVVLSGAVRQGVLLIVLFGLCAFVSLVPVWSQPGWPQNHEYDSFALRTLVYVQHFASFDLLPIWSSLDNGGFGSAQPVLYHKLYYLVAAAVLGLTGSMKGALAGALWLFLLVGALGMHRLVRGLGGSGFASMAAGVLLIVANYTVTDWLVRGAMAELSAAMLIPWALHYFLRTLDTHRIPPGLAVSLGLCFLAHSVICYYLMLLFGLTFVVLLPVARANLKVLSGKAPWLALALFLLSVGPYLVAMSALSPQYDMGRIIADIYHPTNQFHPLRHYLWDSAWSYGKRWNSYTVQLDLPVNLLILVGVAGLLAGRPWDSPSWRLRLGNLLPILPLLLLGLLVMGLQMRIAAPFYNNFPGAVFLQFPWRLLALVTPIAIAVALHLAERTLPSWASRAGIAACVVAMFAISGAFAPIEYPRMARLSPAAVDSVRFSSYGEYVPRSVPSRSAPPRQQVRAAAEASGCAIEGNPLTEREVARLTLQVRCAGAARLSLPLFGSPLHRVLVSPLHGSPVQSPCIESSSFPALCGIAVPAGDSRVDIEMPRFSFLARWLAAQVGIGDGG